MAADIAASLKSWSTNEANNEPIGSRLVGPNTDDNFRMIQAVVRSLASRDTIASAATCDLGSKNAAFLTITGNTGITSLGTVDEGIFKWVVFQQALTIAHNGASLILPTASNIATVAGDSALFLSLGSGNWRCLSYSRSDGRQVSGTTTFGDGTVGAPAIAFTSDPSSGFYRIGTSNVGLSLGGTKRVDFGAANLAITTPVAIAATLSVGGQITASAGLVGNVLGCTSIAGSGTLTFSGMTRIQPVTSSTDDSVQVGASANSGLFFRTTGHTLNYGDNICGLSYGGSYSGKSLFLCADGVVTRARTASTAQAVHLVDTNSAAATTFHLLMARTSSDGVPDVEFAVRGDGTVFSDGGASMTTPADYAEMFEWEDGNPDAEDRVGMSVALQGSKIRVAQPGDEPIGVVSAMPAVLADAGDLRWSGKYLRDDFGRYVLNPDGTRVENPDFDPAAEYIPRRDRPEWAPVGLMGKLRVRDGQQIGSRWVLMRPIAPGIDEYLVR